LQNTEHPTLFIDIDRCKRNIKNMVEKTSLAGCEFRPHFKTHQSHEIGRWIKEHGVRGITVSSPHMGLYFAEDGWDDMTIAFPFYPGMIEDLKKLEQKSKLRLFLHSPDQIEFLEQELKNPFKFYIEIDAGYNRSGIHFESTEAISDLIQKAEKSRKVQFHGFYIHDGRTYKAKGVDGVTEAVSSSLNTLKNLKDKYPEYVVSLGDTPSASMLNDFDKIDELTPGNFVFFDWTQVQIGSCSLDDVAVFVQAPVAQVIDNGNKAIIHGGAVHFSKDTINVYDNATYGQAVVFKNGSIKTIDECYLSALSQEHGTLTGFKSYPDQKHVWICPVHSCLTVNLFKHYVALDGSIIKKRVLS
jgi:D-serine deaminase-like pyridoxal phosphate-dependent protein